jgi:hypothetical protein
MNGKRWVLSLIGGFSAGLAQAAGGPLVVHEWGTFTSFQDERGATIAGINVDDEPLPKFVHRLGDVPIFTRSSLPATWSQGAPRCHADVTMRLETPVIYFYPPQDWQPVSIDVSASFVGGWLTEFFPAADSNGAGFPATIDAAARGSLTWRGLRLNEASDALLPETDAHVWRAPRNVNAATVFNPATQEAEKYLFYRGVGNLDAPVVVSRKGDILHFSLRDGASKLESLPRLWLVDVGADGHLFMKVVKPAGRTAQAAASTFAIGGAWNNRAGLERELAAALQAAGLRADEAAAMLDTWKLSYFESPGLRVFFLLPRSWIDAHLPLEFSTPTEITRVMVGRIELVTGQQRTTLAKLAALPESDFPRMPLYGESTEVLTAMRRGDLSETELYKLAGRAVPESLALYDSLGRFRDALLAHELAQEPDPARRTRLDRIMRYYSACFR